MRSLGDRIHEHIDGEEAARLLAKYYGGRYTGSRYDTLEQLKSPDAYRFTAHDVAAVATLSVPLSGRAVVGLFDNEVKLMELLHAIPTDTELAGAGHDVIEAIFAIQRELDAVDDIGHVTRSKLLARKRPALVPIRDQYVLTALIGRSHGPLTVPLRDALTADPAITERLHELQRKAPTPASISSLRVLDVVVWMATHGDSQVTD